MKPSLVVVGMSHRTAALDVRELLAVPTDALGPAASALTALPHVREAMVVATCNRLEVYAASDRAAACAEGIRAYLSARAPGADVEASLYEHHGEAALRHVFRVASSLDSMVVGEPQILGQVKQAYAAARSAGTTGPSLARALSRAFAAAKRVRSETSIGSGSVSVASVAADLAQQIFGDLAGRTVLLVGAGKMALSAARALVQRGARLAVANRSYERAEALARRHEGEAHPLASLELLLPHVDVVLCSTGASRYVLTREAVAAAMKVRRGRALFLIDIAVPRNVDPRAHDLDSVFLFDVDDLERQVARALGERGGALEAAERILDEELRSYLVDQTRGAVVPTIAALRERFRVAARAELERSLATKLRHLGPADRAALEAMLDAVVGKLLHAPTAALRDQAGTADGPALAAVVRALFQLPADPAGDADAAAGEGAAASRAAGDEGAA